MPQAERRAEAVWEGNLIQGQGKIVNVGSGALSGLPVTWASRTEHSDGKTSPEELIAAAHASCYAMQLSHILAQAGTPAQSLDVNAVCTFVVDASGARVESMHIDVRGKVSGLDEAGFQQAAQSAAENCPVSRALRNNVAISHTAHLEQ